MSASDKKKLRKEQESVFITEKQRAEQKEAKKLKVYTIAFVSAMALVVLIAVASLIIRGVTQSGVFEKSTIAASVEDVQLNTVEFNYYYNDAINKMYNEAYSQYSTYFELYFDSLGLDVTKPLNEQVQDKETGATWADYFVDTALENAKSDLTMEKLAKEAGFTLSEDQQKELQSTLSSIETNAKLYGYSNAEQYLNIVYGYGSDMDSYSKYLERTELAHAFYENYYDELKYDDAAIRDYEKDKAADFNSYTYHSAYLSYTEFRENGTKNEETGETEYTDEQNEAAKKKLKEAAEALATATTLEELQAKAKEVPVNESSSISVNKETDLLHTSINATLSKWLAADERKEGDIAAIPNLSTDAKEGDLANGYYVVYFVSRNDNKTAMGNVRHLLVQFEGGTENEETGVKEYSEEEKKTAKDEAEKYFQEWKDGEATQDSFIEMVKKYSDDSSAADGGLFEDINPASNYVPEFLSWSIDPNRKEGDAEVIETEFGYHVMFYVGNSQLNYRDHMITQQMKTEAQAEWYEGALKDVSAAKLNLKHVPLDMSIANN
ncbi:MAG: peptidylprolyl isomerase [Oscillospiraceae bacterium]|nr:peptidylprolyl isomerase [Oscillospiraceae bacterium]